MKKLLSIVMILCLTMSVALAEEAVLNWSDFEPILEQAGVTGDFYTFDEIAVKLWLPDGLEAVELSDEDKSEGYIGYYMPADQSAAVAVMYVDVNGMTLEDYAAYLASDEIGATEIEYGTVNGLPCVSYSLPEKDVVCVTFTTEAGYVLEVTCWPASEENAEYVWGAVISSIQGA